MCDYENDMTMTEMKNFMKKLKLPKKKREMCVAGIEMMLFGKEDILYIADGQVTEHVAQSYLHKKIMDM